MLLILSIFIFSPIFSQVDYCPVEPEMTHRSIYSVGDTLSTEDQNLLFPVCNGTDDYASGDYFSFSDLNGIQNNGDYKITLISMNATW